MIPINQKRVDSGMYWMRAWSLVEGCTPVSEGCANCWSMDATHTRAGQTNEKIKARYGGLTTGTGKWTGEIRLMEDSLSLPLRVKKPTTWAVWNDLFHEGVPFEFVDQAFKTMAFASQHTFLVLTKRPERMLGYMQQKGIRDGIGEYPLAPFQNRALPNVALGTTAENQAAADTRIPHLLQTPAAWRFLSCEPLLGEIDLTYYLARNSLFKAEQYAGQGNYRGERQTDGSVIAVCDDGTKFYDGVDLHWIIAGTESGSHRRPSDLDWFRHLYDLCQVANVPFFLKQAEIEGRVVKMPELDGRTWDQMPEATQ